MRGRPDDAPVIADRSAHSALLAAFVTPREIFVISIHALYEKRQPQDRFDMDYLLGRRIPFVKQVLAPYGLLDIVVHKCLEPPGIKVAPRFVCIIVLTFSNLEGFVKGWKEQSERLNAGIAEFTNIEPLVQISEIP